MRGDICRLCAGTGEREGITSLDDVHVEIVIETCSACDGLGLEGYGRWTRIVQPSAEQSAEAMNKAVEAAERARGLLCSRKQRSYKAN